MMKFLKRESIILKMVGFWIKIATKWNLNQVLHIVIEGDVMLELREKIETSIMMIMIKKNKQKKF